MYTIFNISMEEIWKPIPGYEGFYEASDFGNVRSVKRNGTRINGTILAAAKAKRGGYMRVSLSVFGKTKNCLVHRLVWEAFNGRIPESMCINHKDENKENNNLSNLELLTYAQNNIYGTRLERVRAKTLNGPCSKAISQYDLCGNLIKEFPSISEAARYMEMVGYSKKAAQTNIWNCLNNKRGAKRAYGFIWKYKY